MSISPEFVTYLQDQFESFGPVSIRSMFGGAGVFRDNVMFGLIAWETLYLKTGDGNRADYEAAGMEPFTYEGKSKPIAMSYHQVPPDILEDAEALGEWSRKAFDVALAAQKAKPPKRKRRKKSA